MKPEERRATSTVLEELGLSYEARARGELSLVKKLAKRSDARAPTIIIEYPMSCASSKI